MFFFLEVLVFQRIDLSHFSGSAHFSDFSTLFCAPTRRLCLHPRAHTLPPSQVAGLPLECISVDAVCASVWARLPEAAVTATSPYMNAQLGLGTLMRERMAAMSPSAYEAVLHPIFQVVYILFYQNNVSLQ